MVLNICDWIKEIITANYGQENYFLNKFHYDISDDDIIARYLTISVLRQLKRIVEVEDEGDN